MQCAAHIRFSKTFACGTDCCVSSTSDSTGGITPAPAHPRESLYNHQHEGILASRDSCQLNLYRRSPDSHILGGLWLVLHCAIRGSLSGTLLWAMFSTPKFTSPSSIPVINGKLRARDALSLLFLPSSASSLTHAKRPRLPDRSGRNGHAASSKYSEAFFQKVWLSAFFGPLSAPIIHHISTPHVHLARTEPPTTFPDLLLSSQRSPPLLWRVM